LSVETFAGKRYTVTETLGSGGMAIVYRAHDRELDRDVAIKVLAEHLATDAEFRERFLREGKLAGRLSHPNIVNVYDAGEADGRPFIVMEHVEGVTLADELAGRGRFPLPDAVELIVQACAGLEHAHEHGLVHRDIKPRNLLLRPDGLLKIADFGIARAVGGTQLTASGTVLGTAVYSAPEQASGEQVTTAADIYSLGAVLYELISGRPPFTFETLPELVLKQRTGRVASLTGEVPGVPDRLDEVVLRCLAPEPAARPPSAAALASELAEAAALAGRRSRSGASDPGRRRRRRRQRRQLPTLRHAAGRGAGAVRLDARRTGTQPRGLDPRELSLGRRDLGRRDFLRAEGDALAGKRQLDFLARLVDPPLDGRERDLERVGDLRVGKPDDVPEEKRHLEVDVHRLDRAPDRIHRLDLLDGRVDNLEQVRRIVEDDREPRSSLDGAQLVEDPVLRHLEEPRSETATQREVRQSLEDAEENLLRQVLGQRAVADQPHDVVEDRLLVRADDQREGPLVAALGLAQYSEVRLL
jgi:tRNA A-37 threonylcarbamoyl transferase component Bud32